MFLKVYPCFYEGITIFESFSYLFRTIGIEILMCVSVYVSFLPQERKIMKLLTRKLSIIIFFVLIHQGWVFSFFFLKNKENEGKIILLYTDYVY